MLSTMAINHGVLYSENCFLPFGWLSTCTHFWKDWWVVRTECPQLWLCGRFFLLPSSHFCGYESTHSFQSQAAPTWWSVGSRVNNIFLQLRQNSTRRIFAADACMHTPWFFICSEGLELRLHAGLKHTMICSVGRVDWAKVCRRNKRPVKEPKAWKDESQCTNTMDQCLACDGIDYPTIFQPRLNWCRESCERD